MTIKNQIHTLKENWLIAVITLIVVIVLMNSSNLSYMASDSIGAFNSKSGVDYGMIESASSYYSETRYYDDQDFAPGIESRKIVQSGSIDIEVKRGSYYDSEKDLKKIIDLSDSYLLNENVNDYGLGRKSQLGGNYQIKVNTKDYDLVVEQLKKIGEVKSLNNNLQDVTGSYEDVSIEIEVEKSRLKRYEEMYSEAKSVQEKLDLNDRIFNQERTIKYLEDRMDNLDKRIEYSTIYFSMNEERSSYADFAFIKLGQLITDLVNSFNFLISLFFRVLPWAIAYVIIRIVYTKVKKNKKR